MDRMCSIIPTPPVPLPTDTQGYQYGITMDTEKDLTALFDMIPLPAPGAIMGTDVDVKTIPGTSTTAKGTPVIEQVHVTYPAILAGSYPGVKADMLLQTNRDGGFTGLRLIGITPNSFGTTFLPINLGSITGIYGTAGNDILLSQIYDILDGAGIYIPPTLESLSGATITYTFTFDGFMDNGVVPGEDYGFWMDFNAIAYKDAALDYGLTGYHNLCATELADTRFNFVIAEVAQDLNTGTARHAAGSWSTNAITLIQCDGDYTFNTTTTYPTILDIDLAGEIKNNAYFIFDQDIPAGASLTGKYNNTVIGTAWAIGGLVGQLGLSITFLTGLFSLIPVHPHHWKDIVDKQSCGHSQSTSLRRSFINRYIQPGYAASRSTEWCRLSLWCIVGSSVSQHQH